MCHLHLEREKYRSREVLHRFPYWFYDCSISAPSSVIGGGSEQDTCPGAVFEGVPESLQEPLLWWHSLCTPAREARQPCAP